MWKKIKAVATHPVTIGVVGVAGGIVVGGITVLGEYPKRWILGPGAKRLGE